MMLRSRLLANYLIAPRPFLKELRCLKLKTIRRTMRKTIPTFSRLSRFQAYASSCAQLVLAQQARLR